MRGQMKWIPTPSYKEGQTVWLLIKSWQPQVLEVCWIGLFEIQEVLHNACQLRLPSMLRIYPVINVVYLKPAISTMSSDPSCPVLANPQQMADWEWDV